MRGVKRKKTKPTKPDNPAQSARFIAAAKELGPEDGQAFERAMYAIVKKKSVKGKK